MKCESPNNTLQYLVEEQVNELSYSNFLERHYKLEMCDTYQDFFNLFLLFNSAYHTNNLPVPHCLSYGIYIHGIGEEVTIYGGRRVVGITLC